MEEKALVTASIATVFISASCIEDVSTRTWGHNGASGRRHFHGRVPVGVPSPLAPRQRLGVGKHPEQRGARRSVLKASRENVESLTCDVKGATTTTSMPEEQFCSATRKHVS